MPTLQFITQRLCAACDLTHDLYAHIEPGQLALKIPGVPSNTIAEQAYCIIGARWSYLRALQQGRWLGFESPFQDINNHPALLQALTDSRDQLLAWLQTADPQTLNRTLLIDLLEHETQHHGQLIRYTYANKLTFPTSWHTRYHV